MRIGKVAGYQDRSAADYQEPAVGWRWVTGEPFRYAPWEVGEPNDSDGEDVMEYLPSGRANDLSAAATLGGYLVEFELQAPSALQAQMTGPGRIRLAWTDSSGVETAFAIWRKSGMGDWVRIAVTAPDVTSYLDNTADTGSRQTYRVRSVSEFGASDWSNEAEVVPTLPPARPTNLRVMAAPPSRLDLTWSDESDNETAFAVWRRQGVGAWTRIAVLAPNTTQFPDATAIPGTPYTYRIRAIGLGGASDWTPEVDSTPVTPP